MHYFFPLYDIVTLLYQIKDSKPGFKLDKEVAEKLLKDLYDRSSNLLVRIDFL